MLFRETIVDIGVTGNDPEATIYVDNNEYGQPSVYIDMAARTPLTVMQVLELTQVLTRAAIVVIAEEREQ